uniref:Reverse transcriptase domain-containing protein n=1 Tax=Tanacetum cinerariifolium TaxID=118510 RepID=A0A699GQH4_TANCI|nr:hypothetical protein [Tanacetum cinerariifolium]
MLLFKVICRGGVGFLVFLSAYFIALREDTQEFSMGDFEEGATGNTNIKQCLRKVTDGHFTAKVKVLSSSGVAPYYDDTIKALEAKHPYKPPPSMPSITFSEPPLVAEIDSVFSCIKSFPKGTSCERDGLRAQHILDAIYGEGFVTATDLLKVITSIINLWSVGRCPPILVEFVASAPLTLLLKSDNEIRPIAVGTIWRCLVFKVSMKGVGKEMSEYLSDFQFGVGVSGGAKAILHRINQVLSEYHNDRSLAMLIVDFSNAFNLVDRLALSVPPFLCDPLGPFLFALILHPLLHKIKDSCKLLLHAWYLDDVIVIGDLKEVARVLDIIKVSGPGIKLLGGAVSRDLDFISRLAMRRAVIAVDLMGLLLQLHDPQSLLGSIENIVVCGGPFFRDLQWRLSSLPIRFGGLGLYSRKLVSSYSIVSALACLRDTIPSFDVSSFTNKDTIPFKAQQTLRMDILFDICRCARISAKKEAPMNLLTDPSGGRSTLRPADVLVFGWVRGKHACVVLTEVSPLVWLSSRGFTAYQTTLKVASGKVTKHKKSCIKNQHVFIPFAFDTFGFLTPEAVELLSRVQRDMHNNVLTPRSTDVVFKRIGFAIQKGLAAQLVTRLPSTTIKFKGKDIVDNAAQVSNVTTIALGIYKLDLITSAPKDKNKRETHIYYHKHTMDQAAILMEIVEQAKSLNHLDSASYSACNSMFDARHELCFLEFVSNMNASSKSKFVKTAKKKEEWKLTRKVFTKTGYNWRPTERTFTLVRNMCHLTRITAINKVPLREPIPLEVVAQESVVTKVYTRRPKVPNTNGSNSKPKIAKSVISNKQNHVHLRDPILQLLYLLLLLSISVLVANAPRAVDLANSPLSTLIDQDAPSISIPSTQEQEHSLIISQGFKESPKTPHFHDDPLYKSLHEDSTSQGSSSTVRLIYTSFKSLGRWTEDNPIENVIRDPSRFVSTRKQLQTDAMWCYFDAFLTSVKPKNFKQVMIEPS